MTGKLYISLWLTFGFFFTVLYFTQQCKITGQMKPFASSVHLQGEGINPEFIFSSTKGKVRSEKYRAAKQGKLWAGISLEVENLLSCSKLWFSNDGPLHQLRMWWSDTWTFKSHGIFVQKWKKRGYTMIRRFHFFSEGVCSANPERIGCSY